ncbi:MAG: hypothetical protein AB7L13_04990 [Acidimicrobiia bacterium]
MDAQTQRLIDDVERWFVRRGLPHAIDDYSARDDVLTRTLPFLAAVFVLEVMTTTFGDRFTGWEQAGALVAAVAVVTTGIALTNRARGRRTFQLPDRVGWMELGLFAVLPAGLALALDGSPTEAVALICVNVALGGLAFGFAYFGVLPMVLFGLRQVWRRVKTLTQLLANVLPLLLLFVTFVFLNAEMWQVANDFTPAAYAVVVGLIAAVAFAFVAVRLPVEIDALAHFDAWDDVASTAARSGAPTLAMCGDPTGRPSAQLDRRDRRNVSVLLFVSYAVQVLLIGVVVATVLVVFGLFAIREATILQWTVQPNDAIHALFSFRLAGQRHVLTWEHLAVSGFIGVFSMLQFAVQLLRDNEYRAQFADDVSGEIREVMAVQVLYQQLVGKPADSSAQSG